MGDGYLHADYAGSFSESGRPRHLPSSDGWLIERDIPDTAWRDAMGCYPLFCCANWRTLADDINASAGELVSLVLVADPLADCDPGTLRSSFDLVRPLKEHFVVETGRPIDDIVSRSHRSHATRALRTVTVERCLTPLAYLEEWNQLFGALAVRHSITDMRRFSRTAFARQLAGLGLVMFRASVDGRTVGFDLWFEQGDSAQAHLAAFDATGYDTHASYATKWSAISYFNDRVRWINLGGGTTERGDDNLGRFKRGWATGTRTAWLCGRMFRPDVCADILAMKAIEDGGAYFPPYRSGEFC